MSTPDDPNDDFSVHCTADGESGDTLPEVAEYLGSYASIPEYLRAMLEPEVTPGCAWILDHLDYRAVQRRWESAGSRLLLADGHVYRVATGRGT